MPVASKVDHREIAQLLAEIDNPDVKLKKNEINFIADLIDRKVVEFSGDEARKVRVLYEKRVTQGDRDSD